MKMAKKDKMLLVYVVVGAFLYFVILAPGVGAEPIGADGSGSPGVDVGCVRQTGTTADGFPYFETVGCGAAEAIIGGNLVTHMWLESSATADASTDFTDVTITASDSSGVNILQTWENGNGVAGRQIAPLNRNQVHVFTTRSIGNTGIACSVSPITCDIGEEKGYNGAETSCQCLYKADDHIGNPRAFTVEMTGNWDLGGVPQSTVVSNTRNVIIEATPTGGFTVSVLDFQV